MSVYCLVALFVAYVYLSSGCPDGTSKCSDEGQTCSNSGQNVVFYGSGSTYTSKTITGDVSCTNAEFGDPTPNVFKECCLPSTVVLKTYHDTYVYCSKSTYTYCSFVGLFGCWSWTTDTTYTINHAHPDNPSENNWPTEEEKFSMVPYGSNYAIRTSHGTFLSAQPDGSLDCDRTAMGMWELFQRSDVSGKSNTYYFRSSPHGKYMVAEESSGMKCDRTNPDVWEEFEALSV